MLKPTPSTKATSHTKGVTCDWPPNHFQFENALRKKRARHHLPSWWQEKKTSLNNHFFWSTNVRANTSVNNCPKRYHIRFLHLSIWHLLLFRFTSPWYSLPLSLVNKEPSPRRLREYIRLLCKSSCPHGPSTSITYSCCFTNVSHIPHFHDLTVT